MVKSSRLAAVAIFAAACGGGAAPDPGGGRIVATLDHRGDTIAVSVDNGDVYVILLDAKSSPKMAVERVHGTEVTPMPLGPVDWSDYADSLMVGLDPPKTALVSGGKAYFLGAYGVTILPLDGTPGRTLYPPAPSPAPPTDHAYDSMGAFTVDEGNVYVCDRDLTTNSNNFARFRTDGTWEVLFTGPTPIDDDDCFAAAVAVDADAVYWSTSQAIRAFNKLDGTVRTVVALQGPSLPPPLLAVGGESLFWFDDFDTAFHGTPKSGTTPAISTALGATTLLPIVPTDPAPFSMIGAGDRVYWMTPFDLHQMPFAGAAANVLAHRARQGGLYLGLAADSQYVYFTNSDLDSGSDAGSGEVTLRAVPL
jgi:hypothetical protein